MGRKELIMKTYFASFFLSEMVEIRIGSSGPHHRPPPYNRPMNKYELIAFFVILTLFIALCIIAILSQPKTVPPNSGDVMPVKGEAQPAPEPSPEAPAPVPAPPESSKPAPSNEAPAPVPAKPAPSNEAPAPVPAKPSPSNEAPAPPVPAKPAPSNEAPAPVPAKPSPSNEAPAPVPAKPSPVPSAQPGDIIPDVKAIAASISEGNPLPVEEINDASKETFYGKLMHMR